MGSAYRTHEVNYDHNNKPWRSNDIPRRYLSVADRRDDVGSHRNYHKPKRAPTLRQKAAAIRGMHPETRGMNLPKVRASFSEGRTLSEPFRTFLGCGCGASPI